MRAGLRHRHRPGARKSGATAYSGVNLDMTQKQKTILNSVLQSDIRPSVETVAQQKFWTTKQAAALAPLMDVLKTTATAAVILTANSADRRGHRESQRTAHGPGDLGEGSATAISALSPTRYSYRRSDGRAPALTTSNSPASMARCSG